MSCRLASAPSSVLRAVVNHYPCRSLYPGASLSSRPAGRTLKALLLVGTLNWSSSVLSERIPCEQRGGILYIRFLFWMTTGLKQVCQEKSPRTVWDWCTGSSGENLYCKKKKKEKKETEFANTLCSLTALGKIGHKIGPFEKPWTSGKLFPQYSQLFQQLLWLWVSQSSGSLCGWDSEKDDHCQ